MAVAHFKFGDLDMQRQFSPPARAGELKYWYRAAAKAFNSADVPLWNDSFIGSAHYDVETIVFEGVSPKNVAWSMIIARKRNLR